MTFVVRKPGSSITEAQVMEFIAKQACSLFIYETFIDIFKGYVFIRGSVFCLQFMKSSLDDIHSFFFHIGQNYGLMNQPLSDS